jgi:hypothetical protein
MTNKVQDLVPTDEVDFDTAVTDPAAYYESPAAIVADPDLTHAQRRYFLMEWAQDIEDRQVGVDEGMGAAELSGSDHDAQLLQSLRDCLATLPDGQDNQPPSAVARLWRRLIAG